MEHGLEKNNRKQVETYILSVINSLDSSKFNENLYKGLFKRLNDKEFNNFKAMLKSGEEVLQLVSCKGTDKDISELLKIAEKLKVKIFHKVTGKIPGTDIDYTSDIKVKVLDMIVRRASQDASKGISVAKDTKRRNPITGQTTGPSKGVGLTLPEIKIINARNTPEILEELLSFRSGDLQARRAADSYLSKYGTVRLSDLKQYSTVSSSTKMIQNYFKAALIDFSTKPVKK